MLVFNVYMKPFTVEDEKFIDEDSCSKTAEEEVHGVYNKCSCDE